MWLVPHFVGLDVAGAATQLHVNRKVVSIYQTQSNAVLDAAVRQGRMRHGKAEIFSRSETAKPLMRAVRQGAVFFNLPDMDFGERDSIFVPFFGVPAATITGLSRLAQLTDAVVVPALTRQLPGGGGYELRFYPAWSNFPSGDVVADTRRMNEFIEQRVREMPEQYYWVHRRFKTRPPGEPKIY